MVFYGFPKLNICICYNRTLGVKRMGGDLLRTAGAIGAGVLVAVLLPYVVTVFLVGKHAGVWTQENQQEKWTIEVQGEQVLMLEEEYLLGALAAVMPANYEKEALKAMAVVLRTNLYLQKQNEVVVDVPFLSRQQRLQSQGFEGYMEYESIGQEILRETAGKTVTVKGKEILCPYHRVSAGKTREATGEYGYIKSVDSEEDKQSEEYLTVIRCSREQLKQAFPKVSEEQWSRIQLKKDGETSYINEVCLGEQSLSGEEFRRQLSLCSSAYDVVWLEKKLQIVCKGQGHGFGLSCYGANVLAQKGKNWKEILSYYYELE